MNKSLKRIMLIDDSPDDNFFHERVIQKAFVETIVITMHNGFEALEYLKSNKDNIDMNPDLIFLDINMPGMNGWEFLKEYNQMDKKLQTQVVIIMLTTADNSDYTAKAKIWSFISDSITKPLTKEIMIKIAGTYFTSNL